jgi:hypothetical protein
MTATEAVLSRLEAAAMASHQATLATLQLCRSLLTESSARSADDDDWLRMPSQTKRCPISGWSRTTLNRHITSGDVRKKRISSCAYYSGADVRKLISD